MLGYELIYMGLLMVGLLLILWLSEYLYNKRQIPTEYTRKIAHILGSLSSLIFIYIFDSYWYVIGIGIFFFLLLFFGKRRKAINSIDAVERKTSGSFLLPIAIGGLFVAAKVEGNNLLYVLPVLILGISDPLAGIIGTYFHKKTNNIQLWGKPLQKTYLGSMAFFSSAALLSMWALSLYGLFFAQAAADAIIIATISTFVEMISTNGFDNILVPFAVFFTILFLQFL